ncbi:MAG: hypothetical protein ACK56I_20500, partial [bacterium]
AASARVGAFNSTPPAAQALSISKRPPTSNSPNISIIPFPHHSCSQVFKAMSSGVKMTIVHAIQRPGAGARRSCTTIINQTALPMMP